MTECPDSLLGDGSILSMMSLARLAQPGLFAEVGVYKGGSAWHLATLGRELHLFDTFAGIPHSGGGDLHNVGDFDDCSAKAVAKAIPSAILHVGVFPATLTKELTGFAFVHVDCDQYKSVKACIDHLGPRMVSGGIMLFDDYLCLDGATKAIDEAFPIVCRTPQTKAFVIFQ